MLEANQEFSYSYIYIAIGIKKSIDYFCFVVIQEEFL
jgi:hypothetical protein